MGILSDFDTFRTRPLTGKVYFTVKDIQHLPEFPEGPLLELLQGELFMVPSSTTLHKKISRELTLKLGNYLSNSNEGELFIAPIDVILSDEDLVIPDLIIITKENHSIIQEKNIRGAPDIVFEILSSNRSQDLERKKEIYEKYGILEYYVIDPLERIIYYFKFSRGKYRDPLVLSGTDLLETEILGNLNLQINEIFNV